ncbi:MAG: UvrD-helicase domain-containing protein, partial [Propionibacteriaceae bacterium]|nr:UvrD-helicase domain-containing protein [Propionibacteriaceae bacterium]
MTTPDTAFDLCGPLPRGTWSLEASAGTGKTHTIAALLTRYLAEGLANWQQFAVVTFSRSAAGELSGRIRERLRQSVRILRETLASGKPAGLDEVDDLLASASPQELRIRLERLESGLAQLDSFQIGTIHEFCAAMLTELGVLARADARATLVEDFGILRGQVVQDVYLRRYATAAEPPFNLETADQLGKAVLSVPDALIVPADGVGKVAERVGFAEDVRTAMSARKRQLGVYGHDDQLLRLRDSVSGTGAESARKRLRDRYRVVFVDEFQDTDPIQWEILRTCFHGHSTLILIGDPKQAIYTFRGADVSTYLAATGQADEQRSLLVNYRSDRQMVEGLNTIFHNALLGERIGVPAVTTRQQEPRITGVAAAIRLRCVDSAKPLGIAAARQAITADLVAQVSALLADAQLSAVDGWRGLRGSDIAVLVRSNSSGRLIAKALTEAGVPVAFSGVDSVF